MRIAQQQRAAAILATYGKPRPANKGRHQAATNSTGGTPIAPRLVPPPANGLEVTGEPFGEGATGRVCWAASTKPRAVAAKVVRKRLSASSSAGSERKSQLHRPLRHPHICTLHGAIDEGDAITMVLSMCLRWPAVRHDGPCAGDEHSDRRGAPAPRLLPAVRRAAWPPSQRRRSPRYQVGAPHVPIQASTIGHPSSLRSCASTTRALTACYSLVSTSSCAAFPLFRAG